MTTITVEPLSRQQHPFELQRDYGPDTPATALQKNGDNLLLAELEKAITRKCGYGRERPTMAGAPVELDTGERPTVGELSAADLEDAVLTVERQVNGWRLTGEESEPLLLRLDLHFTPLQEARAARQADAEALAEQHRADEQRRQEEYARAWRQQRLTEMVSELATMGALDEMRELLDERAALEATA